MLFQQICQSISQLHGMAVTENRESDIFGKILTGGIRIAVTPALVVAVFPLWAFFYRFHEQLLHGVKSQCKKPTRCVGHSTGHQEQKQPDGGRMKHQRSRGQPAMLSSEWFFYVPPGKISKHQRQRGETEHRKLRWLMRTVDACEGKKRLVPQIDTVADEPDADDGPERKQPGGPCAACREEDDQRGPTNRHEGVERRKRGRVVEGEDRENDQAQPEGSQNIIPFLFLADLHESA